MGKTSKVVAKNIDQKREERIKKFIGKKEERQKKGRSEVAYLMKQGRKREKGQHMKLGDSRPLFYVYILNKKLILFVK